ncbi:hypothetical protein PIB30_057038 [Stylosanthes scabra]|uniref:Uncharacterized protein n=1 Tax=Stylosanthes scabra TaxID=79078 RepID=A0ABU6TK34_9FABA|nr:hypothetical protein [Stylosanthes scabra]
MVDSAKAGLKPSTSALRKGEIEENTKGTRTRNQEHVQVSDGLKEMKAFRQRLPAFKMKSEFLKAIQENQGFTYPMEEHFLEDVLEKT